MDSESSTITFTSLSKYDHKLDHLILEAPDGFFFVIDCRTGQILFHSDNIDQVLGKSHWCGKNFYHQIHPDDIDKVKEHLNTLEPHHSAKILDLSNEDENLGQIRRSFICRMKVDNLEKEQNYAVVLCTGYIQHWQATDLPIHFDNNDSLANNDWAENSTDSQTDNDDSAINFCFVATGHLQHTGIDDIEDFLVKNNNEFVSRLTTTGEFLFVDHKVTDILGYTTSDLLGSSLFNLIHPDDCDRMQNYFEKLLKSKGLDTFSESYKIRAENSHWICIDASAFAFLNPFTHQIEYIVLTSSVNDSIHDILENFDKHTGKDIFTAHSQLGHEESDHSILSIAHHMAQHAVEHVTEKITEHYKAIPQSRKMNVIISKMYTRLFMMNRLAKRLCAHI